MERWGWSIEEKDCHTHETLARSLEALDAADFPLPDEALDAYAQAMAAVAEGEVESVPTDSAAAAVRYVVLGTVLVEPLLLTLRRMAQQQASGRRFGSGSGPIGFRGGVRDAGGIGYRSCTTGRGHAFRVTWLHGRHVDQNLRVPPRPPDRHRHRTVTGLLRPRPRPSGRVRDHPETDEETRKQLGFLFSGVIYSYAGGFLGLRPVAPGSDAFDEDRVGLDHLSFKVEDAYELQIAIDLLRRPRHRARGDQGHRLRTHPRVPRPRRRGPRAHQPACLLT